MLEKNAFMQIALEEAKRAFNKGEIPVGAVIVNDGVVISSAHNENRSKNNPVSHAEIISIEQASAVLKNERLVDCDLYVTKEPCAMCAGAIIHARLRRIIIGVEDQKYGACGSVLSVCGNNKLNHIPEIEIGILREEALSLLTAFFKNLREGAQI
ncbi:MAG: tRNA adenosine(34) deaminase TadA [Spirochaetota bacterium]|nr:tRNA adenosine(34) deaminase TadA [Spirochaetota bacterium]